MFNAKPVGLAIPSELCILLVMASTTPRLKTTTFTSADGNPFKALAQTMAQADQDAAKRLRMTRAARQANAARRAQKV